MPAADIKRRDKMKRLTSLLMALIMLMTLCACGAAKVSAPMARDVADMEMTEAAPAEVYNSAVTMDAAAEEAGIYGLGVSGAAAADGGEAVIGEGDSEKIIYSADATVETTEFDAALDALTELLRVNKGWIEASSVNGANYYSLSRGTRSLRYASYTLRVPSDKFTALMNSLSTLGNVPYTYTYTENVTAQYYDTQARLTAYQTQEARLLEMMEKAQTVEDIIAIEEKLTELRYKIEALQSTLKNWDRQVTYSTINLSIEEVAEYTPDAAAQPGYARLLLDAFVDGLRAVGEFFSELLVWLVGALPTLAVLGVLAAGIIAGLRRLNARRARKKLLRRPPAADEKPEENKKE